MDHQGGRRGRPAADARQAPWPPAEDPAAAPGQLIGPGTGGYQILEAGGAAAPPRVLEGGTGSHRLLGTGTGSGSGTGTQPTMDRTPMRGFPPAASGYPPSASGYQAPASGYQQPASGSQTPATGSQTPASGIQAAATGYQTPASGIQQATSGFLAYQEPTAGFPAYRQQAAGPAEPATPPQGLPVAADDPVPPASMTPGPGPGPGGRRAARAAAAGSRRRSARTAWLALGIALVVVAGALVGYKFLYEPRVNAPVSGSLRLPTNGPSSPGFDQSLGKWQHIGARSQDPSPLTLTQLFPPQFELDGSSYVRTAAAVSKDCTQAVFGANLQAALQAGHCTQVLRASYISGNGTMMGTVGVANLIGSNAAAKAGATTGPQEIIAPLAAQKGPTSKLGNGTGVVQAEIKGHYLILMWAEFTSRKSPSTSAQRQQLEQFAAALVSGSANINLSTRMLTGKPGTS